MVLKWSITGAGDIADRGMAPAINAAPNAKLIAREQSAHEGGAVSVA